MSGYQARQQASYKHRTISVALGSITCFLKMGIVASQIITGRNYKHWTFKKGYQEAKKYFLHYKYIHIYTYIHTCVCINK